MGGLRRPATPIIPMALAWKLGFLAGAAHQVAVDLEDLRTPIGL